jgi:hypothetical protein
MAGRKDYWIERATDSHAAVVKDVLIAGCLDVWKAGCLYGWKERRMSGRMAVFTVKKFLSNA